ncbi:MAG: PPOX class F420-dependent oxidoreductase [Actinomycetota bacterium]|nr:PPOX class F420-dependent oxidoreductase [Actinomycetota bacterium]
MPPLSTAEAESFLAQRHWGVLVTLKSSDGRPQLSNVAYALLDRRIRVSVTDGRAKTANVRRDPRVSLHVTSDDFWTYVVAEGDAQLSPLAAEAGDETCRRLLRLNEAATGHPHTDPDEFFEAMVADRRLELSFEIGNLYPTAR